MGAKRRQRARGEEREQLRGKVVGEPGEACGGGGAANLARDGCYVGGEFFFFDLREERFDD